MTMNIVYAAVSLGIMGLLFALILGFAAKAFAVEEDERIPQITESLPGANCGGCGYPGCGGLAAAIVEGKAPVNACPVGGADCAAKIAAIMGVDAGSTERQVARVHCNGGCNAKDKFNYEGLADCRAAMRAGGNKVCANACLGMGSCVKVCPFDAIHIVDGTAVVDEEKCTACQKCIAECPKGVISLKPAKNPVVVECSSKEKAPDVVKACSVGCIGCKQCEKACPFDAIHVENNVAIIDYSKCKGCKICTKVCPRNIITPVPTKEEKEKYAAAMKAKAEKAAAAAKAKAEKAAAEAAAAKDAADAAPADKA